jgi:predicted HD superfamily hydrolase involved in NAD metabolism
MLLLSKAFGEDMYRAAVAGLVHDCARGLSQDQISEVLKENGIPIPLEDKAFPKIWHARLGAFMLKSKFNIEDREIAEAIRIHPTGAPVMTRLAKLLFIADYIEPTRDFTGVEHLRELAFSDFENTFRIILESKIDHVKQKGKQVHSDAIRALHDMKEE